MMKSAKIMKIQDYILNEDPMIVTPDGKEYIVNLTLSNLLKLDALNDRGDDEDNEGSEMGVMKDFFDIVLGKDNADDFYERNYKLPVYRAAMSFVQDLIANGEAVEEGETPSN